MYILNVFDAGKLSIQLFNLAISPTQGKGETQGEFDNFWTVVGYRQVIYFPFFKESDREQSGFSTLPSRKRCTNAAGEV